VRIATLESLQRQVNSGTFDRGGTIHKFICPINHSVMRDPVTAEDGVNYDREFIDLWIAGHSDHLTSPVSRKPMGPTLTPNADLRADIQKVRTNRTRLPCQLVSTRPSLAPLASLSRQGLCPSASPLLPSTASDPLDLAMHPTLVFSPSQFLSELPVPSAPVLDDAVDSVRDLTRAFDILDGLAEVLSEVLENWGPPRIVVIGNQSAGKSTVLERLCMMPLFPRDRGLCTSVPIRIDIRRSPVQRPTTLETWDTVANRRVGAVRVIPHDGGDVDIREAMGEVLGRQGGGEVSDTHELRVRITSPTLPPMSLVDLPGTMGYPPELKQRTHGLVAAHLAANQDRSTYLVVVRADQNGPRDSGPIEHIMSLGVANRTIGVLTHCDKLDGDRDRELLAGWLRNEASAKDSVPLEPHGWVATMNKELRRVAPDESNYNRLRRQAQRERRWFEEKGLGSEVEAGHATTRALIDRIGAAYSEYEGPPLFVNSDAFVNIARLHTHAELA
jgi:GTP-binding protein EngB required for normal cell division